MAYFNQDLQTGFSFLQNLKPKTKIQHSGHKHESEGTLSHIKPGDNLYRNEQLV